MTAGSFTLIASAIALASVSLAAQQPPPIPPPPTTQLPPAPAALSVPNPLAGLQPGPGDLYRSPDGSDRFVFGARYPAPPPPLPVFGPIACCGYPYLPGPYYGSPYSDFTIADTYKAVMAETYYQRYRQPARGALVLEGVPEAVQVFVDGNYAGLIEDFASRSVDLAAGTHRIELRAPGYDTLTFSVMIGPNSIVRYRAAMAPASAKPTAASVPAQTGTAVATKNLYVIPNCYAGDKPPAATLPKGCDIKKLQTRK